MVFAFLFNFYFIAEKGGRRDFAELCFWTRIKVLAGL